MLSVIIPTLDSERALVPTLAALVPGATAGLITEVLIADGGSRDDTAAVADIAGCSFMAVDGSLGRRLKAAAAAARAPWLLFLPPGSVPDTPWTADALRFVQQTANASRAAVFRRSPPTYSSWRDLGSFLAAAIGTKPSAEQGLLVSRTFYESLDGHSVRAADAEAELIGRIGRKRIVTLSTSVFVASP